MLREDVSWGGRRRGREEGRAGGREGGRREGGGYLEGEHVVLVALRGGGVGKHVVGDLVLLVHVGCCVLLLLLLSSEVCL